MSSVVISSQEGRSPKRTLRRELEAYLGRRLSGRQWARWAKRQRREETAARRQAATAP